MMSTPQFGPPSFGPPSFGPPQFGPPQQAPGFYPPQPGAIPPVATRKRRMWLVVGLPVVLLVVVASVAVGLFLVFHTSDRDEITTATYAFADAIERDDVSAAAGMMCTERATAFRDAAGPTKPGSADTAAPRRRFEVADVRVDGDTASATLRFTGSGATRNLGLRKEGGAWKVCGAP
ncbi:hypothetical protein nbrc107697_32300 [Gordonia crocea]|uniref:DUF4878 domain-containing protein n=1 Tax=Gordonia crocea TaxID=589162 RepID=A0A7I9V210_9ACTN|nr:hypothetical protein nbrc107697_32300 [Gordonia crocea]